MPVVEHVVTENRLHIGKAVRLEKIYMYVREKKDRRTRAIKKAGGVAAGSLLRGFRKVLWARERAT